MNRRQTLAATLAASARIALPMGLFALAGCQTPNRAIRLSGPTMGTRYQVSLAQAVAPDEMPSLRAGIEAVLARVDALMSTYRPDSEVSRFNAARAGAPVAVSAETSAVVDHALRVWSLTSGAFDNSRSAA